MAEAAPSFEAYSDTGIAQALLVRPDLAFAPGDVSEMYMGGGAAMADLLTGWAAGRTRALYLDGARGVDLDIYADDHYGIQRPRAVKAVGEVTLSRVSAAAGPGTVPVGFVVATQRDSLGKELRFVTDVPVVFNATDLARAVTATAQTAGVLGNAQAGAVGRLVDAPFDPSLRVTNAVRFVGGAEEENDEDFRERVRKFLKTLRRGTVPALEYGALQVPTVKRATAAVDQTTGFVTVYVTDAAGHSNAAMEAAVTEELINWAAAGPLWIVTAGTVVFAEVAIALGVRPGVQAAVLVADVVRVVTARINQLQIGEPLYVSALQASAFAVSPDITEARVTINGAVVNIIPALNQIIRPGSVSIG